VAVQIIFKLGVSCVPPTRTDRLTLVNSQADLLEITNWTNKSQTERQLLYAVPCLLSSARLPTCLEKRDFGLIPSLVLIRMNAQSLNRSVTQLSFLPTGTGHSTAGQFARLSLQSNPAVVTGAVLLQH